MKKLLWIVAGLAVIGCVWGCGLVDDQRLATVITIGAVVAVGGGLLGGLAGAGHARERRAWADYQDVRAKLPVARRAWLQALAESARRFVLPVAIAVAVLAWWRWGRR
ncbi:MAG: hypothetical protein HOV87_12270 [Catenulispora sp.]|nr:hypothetical protein [Catenulispora sp.]NUT39977.1 hypothetical protein [Thermoactinospora sp.]